MIAVICVPWMLIFKPLILWSRMPSQPSRAPAHSHSSHSDEDNGQELETPLHMEDELEEVKEDHTPAKGGHDEEHDIS